MPARILAVDDEQSIVRLVQFCLERDGYEVQTALDGESALKMAAATTPDLVIADVMMPFMDGFELVRRLRMDPKTRDVPVIMLTAKTGDDSVSQALIEGADIYLTKPFNPLELRSFVTRLLKGS